MRYGKKIFELAKRNFSYSERRATVQLAVENQGTTLDILYFQINGRTIEPCSPRQHSTKVTFTQEMADKILCGQPIEYRGPFASSQIKVEGDDVAAHLVCEILKTPNEEIRARFLAAERKWDYPLTIKFIDAPDERGIFESYRSSHPTIGRGFLDKWKLTNASMEEFGRKYANVALRVTPDGEIESIGKFVDRVIRKQAADRVYSGGCGLPRPLWKDFSPIFGFQNASCTPPQIWAGSSSQAEPATKLHRDPYCGILCQVIGRKRIVLYSPNQSEFLYPYSSFSHYQTCWVNPCRPDHDLFPLFKHSTPLEAVLEPGEVLFLPTGWYHYTQAVEPTVSISWFLRWASKDKGGSDIDPLGVPYLARSFRYYGALASGEQSS